MRILRLAALATALLALVLAAPGCGEDDGGAKDSASGGTPRTVTVRIKAFKYGPPTVTVPAGSTVRWVNEDRAPHTATAMGAGAFDTGTLRTSGARAIPFKKAGRYPYICEFHPFMKGTVVVE